MSKLRVSLSHRAEEKWSRPFLSLMT